MRAVDWRGTMRRLEGADRYHLYVESAVQHQHTLKVLVIDRDAKVVTTAGARRFAYDTLVLATGSYPFVPPIPGGARDNCLTYRTIDDLGAIRAQAQQDALELAGEDFLLIVVVQDGLHQLEQVAVIARSIVNLLLGSAPKDFGERRFD